MNGLTARILSGLLLIYASAFSLAAIERPLAPYAEFQHINFSDYTDDQTNVGAVTAITQDNRGFMWVGGENGLLRFDGHNVSLYRSNQHNSIPANYVQGLLADGDEYLWIATVGGFSRFSFKTGTFDNIQASSGKIPGNDVLALTKYKNTIFVATTVGLATLNSQTLEIESPPFIEHLPSLLHVRYAYVYGDTLWLGTSQLGLFEVNLAANDVRTYHSDVNDPNSIPHSDIRGIVTPDGETYWLASLGGGLIRLDYSTGKFTQFAALPSADKPFVTNDVWGVYKDSRDYVWVGTDSAGLWRINNVTEQIEGYIHNPTVFESISSQKPRIAFADNQQNIWLGHFSGTVDYLNREQENVLRFKKKNRFHKGLNDPSVLSILPTTNNRFWVGTEGGLNLIDIQDGNKASFDKASGLPADPVLALEHDDNGQLWVGTWGGGLTRFNPTSNEWMHPINLADNAFAIGSHYIWALRNDNRGNLWVGTQKEGIYQLKMSTGEVKHFEFNVPQPDQLGTYSNGIMGEFVRDIRLDNQGNIWVATIHGLSRYDLQRNQFELFPHLKQNANSPASNQAISLLSHSNGDLWIGFRDAGLSIYSPSTQSFNHIDIKSGLPSANVSSLVEGENGTVWAGTPVGLVKIPKEATHLKTYKQVHGLAGSNHNRNASYLLDDGRLMIGSKEGLSIFDHNVLEQTRLSKAAVISRITVNNDPTEKQFLQNGQTHLKALKYNQNAISVEFTLNQFYLPRLNEYQYRLKGLEDNWQKAVRQNSANYTNLDPGHYTFQVKGKSAHGEWGEQVTELSFTIKPPPWRQWWAYILYTCFVYAGFAAYRNYMAVRARSAIYEQLSQQDPLTRLPNRIALNNRVEQWSRNNQKYSVIVADIDHFKRINDTYGHEAGDTLLKEFSRIAKAETRDGDLLGRWGGEEFLIICQSVDIAVTQSIAERIRHAINVQAFEFHDQQIQMTVSFGCAVREENEHFNNLFHRADQALYSAKSYGRNCVKIANKRPKPPNNR